jgi:hypothetical protein
MKLSITGDIALKESSPDSGYVTWLDVRAYHTDSLLGTARVAIVHVGEVSDALGDLWPALKGTKLEALHDVYFERGWYSDAFADGAGIDLLFLESVSVEEAWRARNLDLAIVRRLADTIGSGCQIVAMRYGDAHDAAHWARIGFVSSQPGRSSGLMHMKLGYRHARVIPTTRGDFEVLPSEVTLAQRRAAN